MKITARGLSVVLIAFSLCAGVIGAENLPNATTTIPLTVQAGVPLLVALTKPLPVKRARIPVEGRVVEPVYVFDHLVIPAGSEILGHVTQVENASRKRRALAMANGNFSPIRKADLDFDTLVLKDGTRIHLQTKVSQGTLNVVHLAAGEKDKKKKGRVGQAVDQARQEVKDREHQAIEEAKAPGKMKRVEAALSAQLPYHRPSLPAGTRFTAELKAPLEMGTEDPAPNELDHLGGEVPPGSVIHFP
jgi:hypothetical protein